MTDDSRDYEALLRALDDALRQGDNKAWDAGVRSAPVPLLVRALAERLKGATSQELIILRNLVALATSRRLALRGRINRELKPGASRTVPPSVLDQLREFAGPEPPRGAVARGVAEEFARRIALGCDALAIQGRVREDLVSLEIEAEILEGVELEDLCQLSSERRGSIADGISRRASAGRSSRLPAARRARLSLQAAKVLLLADTPQDNQVAVLNAIGAYCCRQAEAYAEDRKEPDVAQDYALEGAVYQSTSRDFPLALYFHSSISRHLREATGATWRRFQQGDRAARLLNEVAAAVIFSSASAEHRRLVASTAFDMLRLGRRDHNTALSVFYDANERTRAAFAEAYQTSLVRAVTAKGAIETLQRALEAYSSGIAALHNLLQQARAAPALHQIGVLAGPLDATHKGLQEQLWRRELDALRDLAVAAAYAQQADQCADANVRRGLLNTARTNAAQAAEACQELSFGTSYTQPIGHGWVAIIDAAIADAKTLIRPQLSARPYRQTYRVRGALREAQFTLRNDGPGIATAIAVTAHSDGLALDVQLEKASLLADEEQLLLISGEATPTGAFSIALHLSCRDVEANRGDADTPPFVLRPAPSTIDFDSVRDANPFNAGDVVTDPQMFYGRKGILDALVKVVAKTPHNGALRILFGQRRVGKSSILYFLEKALSKMSAPRHVCARVTWLDFAQHRPGDVVLDIARKVVRAARARGASVPEPDRSAYRASYSSEFNELLEGLLESTDVRIALLIDEFDKAYAQLTDPSLGFDEAFFSYLRGLTTRERVTVVLAGGEELPDMVRELGPTFNHAHRHRVSYLPIEDVRLLIRNPYVGWLDFPDAVVDAIYDSAHGNPFFTQILCHDIVDRACEENAIQVTARDVTLSTQELVAMRLTVEQVAHLYQMSGREEPLELAILYLLSRESSMRSTAAIEPADLQAQLRQPEGTIKQALNRLIEREVIRNVPGRVSQVQIVMPLFAEWFKQNCPLRDGAWALVRTQENGGV